MPSTTSRASRSSGTSALDCGSGWTRVKSPFLRQVGPQPLVQLGHDLVGVALQLLGAVLGQLGDRGLGRVPVARTVLVEVGGRRRQPAQGIAEDRRRLARHDAAELDPPVFEAAVAAAVVGAEPR